MNIAEHYNNIVLQNKQLQKERNAALAERNKAIEALDFQIAENGMIRLLAQSVVERFGASETNLTDKEMVRKRLGRK